MLDWSAPLTRKDAVVIASRVVTIYFLAWLVADLLYLPADIHSVHYFWALAARTGQSFDHYLYVDHVRLLSDHTIRVALEFLAAGWSYRCGPGVQRFIFPDSGNTSEEAKRN